MRKILFILFILTTLSSKLLSQITSIKSADTTKSDKVKLYSILGATGGAFIIGHGFLNNMWWKGEKSSFHFNWKEDWSYALGADKAGHFYFPYLVTNIYSQLFQWSGIEENKSYIYSAALGMSYQTYIEIRDGFSKQYGFSWGDFGADALGAGYPLLQNQLPLLKNFNLKISFYPSNKFRQHSNKAIIDDYESTYHWLSVNVKNLLPNEIKNYYPAFINIAIGHSVKGLDEKPYHEFYIALDWNLEALPGDYWLLKILKRNFNYYHFPSPAVRISPGITWFGFKF